MELATPKDCDGPQYDCVTKRLRDANGLPIGTANDYPILDFRVNKVEYQDGYKAALSANDIAINMYAQVDSEGKRHVLFDQILDHQTDGTEVQIQDLYPHSKNYQWHDDIKPLEYITVRLSVVYGLHILLLADAKNWIAIFICKCLQTKVALPKSTQWIRNSYVEMLSKYSAESLESQCH